MGEIFWPCYGRDSARAPSIYQLIPKVLFNLCRTANAISKTTVTVVSPLDYIRKQQVASIEKMDCGICAADIGESIQGDSEIENGKFDIMPNNGLAIVGKKRCSLALFIRQRSWLSMKCILWQHDRFTYVVFA